MEKKMYFLVKGPETPEKIIESPFPVDMQALGLTSCSPGYDTREELIKGEEVLSEPCKECGGLVSSHWLEPKRTQIIESNLCFHCHFWVEVIDIVKHDPNRIIVNGTSYHIKPKAQLTPGFSGFLGHGGRLFKILKLGDEEVIETNNLWCQGDVPEAFRDRLPDNAKFL